MVESKRQLLQEEAVARLQDEDVHRMLESTATVAVVGDSDTCRLTTSLDTGATTGDRVAFGTMFSIRAKKDIRILGFEIGHFPIRNDLLQAEVYTRQGSEFVAFSGDANQWDSMVPLTDALEAPDGKTAIIPVGATQEDPVVNAGETRSFYISLKSQHLRLSIPSNNPNTGEASAGAIGSPYHADDYIEMNVGVGMKSSTFSSDVDNERTFQGIVHYSSVEECDNFPTRSNVIVRFAIHKNHSESARSSIDEAFHQMIESDTVAREWVQYHGLTLSETGMRILGNEQFCDGHAEFSKEDCTVAEITLSFDHTRSIDADVLTTHFVSGIKDKPSIHQLQNEQNIIFVDPWIIEKKFDILLKGMPENNIELNPIQRRYMESVTLSFLKEFAPVTPSAVRVSGPTSESRRLQETMSFGTEHGQTYNLRGSSTDNYNVLPDFDAFDHTYMDDHRQLELTGMLTVQATILGIGHLGAESNYFEQIKTTFKDEDDRYLLELSRQHLRPGEINEREDFGDIFSGLWATAVNYNAQETTSLQEVPEDSQEVERSPIMLIVWSAILALNVGILLYRIVNDYCLPNKGAKKKKQKLDILNADSSDSDDDDSSDDEDFEKKKNFLETFMKNRKPPPQASDDAKKEVPERGLKKAFSMPWVKKETTASEDKPAAQKAALNDVGRGAPKRSASSDALAKMKASVANGKGGGKNQAGTTGRGLKAAHSSPAIRGVARNPSGSKGATRSASRERVTKSPSNHSKDSGKKKSKASKKKSDSRSPSKERTGRSSSKERPAAGRSNSKDRPAKPPQRTNSKDFKRPPKAPKKK